VKLGLGTAQFGMSYGISNLEGRTTIEEAARILNLAAKKDVRVIDTASGYGNSEETIGRVIKSNFSDFLIVTKTPQFGVQAISESEGDLLESTFRESLTRLRRRAIYGLLVHHASDLLLPGSDILWDRMQQLKTSGLIQKIGVSVYHPAEADNLMERRNLDLIQLPLNLLDQRFLKSGCLQKLQRLGVEIHVRSVFLQGLLLMNADELADYFNPVKATLKLFQQFCHERQVSRVEAALGVVCHLPEVSRIICGVNNSGHLLQLIEAERHAPSVDFSAFAFEDIRILIPSFWPNSAS
jgi:aryl-alcohol dehydrogenase-like predicted oxidoreductase